MANKAWKDIQPLKNFLIKAMVRHHHTPVKKAKIKIILIISTFIKYTEQMDLSSIGGKNENWNNHSKKQFSSSF